jgi:hypothetical protein
MGKYLSICKNEIDFYNKRGGQRNYPNVTFIKDTEQIIYSNDVDFPIYLYTEPIIIKQDIYDKVPLVTYIYSFKFPSEKINDIFFNKTNFIYHENINGYTFDYDTIYNNYKIYLNNRLFNMEPSSGYIWNLPITNDDTFTIFPNDILIENIDTDLILSDSGVLENNAIIIKYDLLDPNVVKDRFAILVLDNDNNVIFAYEFYYKEGRDWNTFISEPLINSCFNGAYNVMQIFAVTYNENYSDNYVHIGQDLKHELYIENENYILYDMDNNEPILLTDKIQAKQYIFKVNNNLITFTINNVEYQAEEGMTWEEWVDSEYNSTKEFYISNNNIFGGPYKIKYDGSRSVLITDIITNNYNYILATESGGSDN